VGHVDWSLGFNYNKTDITKINALPSQVYNATYNTSLLTQYAIDGLTTATPRVKIIANALLTHGKWSVNLRETIYGETSQHDSPDGSGEGTNAQLVKIGTSAITDLNIGYKFTSGFRIDVGANNLFDKQAPTYPLAASGTRPLDGNVYNGPVSFTPWGIDGGYWYAKATLNF
jgi:iron complex outermembrane receptor protein